MSQEVQNALGQLSRALNMIENAELNHRRASRAEEEAREKVTDAKAYFNEVRDRVVELCPELLTGFPDGEETVALVDGKIAVVQGD